MLKRIETRIHRNEKINRSNNEKDKKGLKCKNAKEKKRLKHKK